MVFGNRGVTSGAGVAFSRDPSTGAAQPVIDVLVRLARRGRGVGQPHAADRKARSRKRCRHVAAQLRETLALLEREFADVQDIEFTIQDGRLWILQTRAAKRTPQAALRFAIDLVKEGADHAGRGACSGSTASTSTRSRTSASSTAASRRRAAPAPQPASRSAARPSIPTAPNGWRRAAIRSSWCGPTPAPPTSKASPRPPASSPRSAGAPRMRPWWRGRWASPAWSAAPR